LGRALQRERQPEHARQLHGNPSRRQRAEVRLQTGDLITDHIVRLLSHGQELEPKAIAAQMAATNWTPPRGWHIPPQDERQELPLHEALDGAY